MPVFKIRRGFRYALLALVPLVAMLAAAQVPPAPPAPDSPQTLRDGYFVSRHGDSAYLGVSLEEETEYAEGGARVNKVMDDSPAAEAGLQAGDIIVGFEGETIRGPVGLTRKIHGKKPGDQVSLTVIRDGSRRTLDAELGDRVDSWSFLVAPEAPHFAAEEYAAQLEAEMDKLADERHGALMKREWAVVEEDKIRQQIEENLERMESMKFLRHCEEGEDDEDCILQYRSFFPGWGGKPTLGVQLVEVTPELREHLGSSRDNGVLVSKVLAGTPAEAAGITVGDLIVAVDGEEVANSSELRRALQERAGESFDVYVIRDGRQVELEVTIPEPDTEPPSGPRARFAPMPALPALPAPSAVPAAPPPPAAYSHARRAEQASLIEARRAYAQATRDLRADRRAEERERERTHRDAQRQYRETQRLMRQRAPRPATSLILL